MTTSASDVCEKSAYHCPIAKNGSGLSRHTRSSASPRRRATVSGGATGVASTTRRAPCARATWHAARAVEPVAMPSSTTITVRPSEWHRRPIAPEPARPPLQLGALPPLHLGELRVGHLRRTDDLLVHDAHPALADRAHPELGLEGHAELADDDHVERRTERGRDLVRDRDATARQAEHDDVVAPERLQALGEALPGVTPVGERHRSHLPAIGTQPGVGAQLDDEPCPPRPAPRCPTTRTRR
ncbi:MAG: hypothetical protein KatS3mg010_0767 [Acidimicrobiia bacterium]|nr:MAG: hypothetical protein KatS3mg010_0767 [Acidimicrobiia bacterium]